MISITLSAIDLLQRFSSKLPCSTAWCSESISGERGAQGLEIWNRSQRSKLCRHRHSFLGFKFILAEFTFGVLL
jgi:hypothetical protein